MLKISKQIKATYSKILLLLEKQDLWFLCCLATLLLLLTYPFNNWYYKAPIRVLALLGILMPKLTFNSRFFWFLLCSICVAATITGWSVIDNHKYLLTYWCLAIFVSLYVPNPKKSLRITAQYFIGLSFLFATFWKIISPDFLNGDFLHYILLMDDRFQNFVDLTCGISLDAHQVNKDSLKQLVDYKSNLDSVEIKGNIKTEKLALFLTWWTLIIEGVVAIVFLINTKKIEIYRHFFLLLFIISTYSIASVIGFGWLLIIMGIILTKNLPKIRLLYLFSFLILEFYTVPWANLINKILFVFL